MTTTNKGVAVTVAMVDESGAPIPPGSNVLPKGASIEERDVHWFFNWAEGEILASPTFTIFDQELLASRCSVGSYHERVEFTAGQLRAAARMREIDHALDQIAHEHVRTLQRWSLPPTVFAPSMRQTFGRLAGVALRTPTARQLGGDHAVVHACESVARHDKGEVAGLARHRAKLAIAAIEAEATAMVQEAFAAYGAARRRASAIATLMEEHHAMAAFERALQSRGR